MTRLDHALALAKQGFLILPIQPGRKIPYGDESWSAIMTTEEAKIREWFATRPNMNYAVCPGKNGVVIDPDEDAKKGKHGLQTLARLDEENFEEPIGGETFTVKTPRGGQHLYMRTPYSVSNARGDIGDGIDVRGFGGYVVGPGSHTVANESESTAEGTYEVICDKPVLAAPQWLMDKLGTALAKHKDADKPPPQGWDTEAALRNAREIIARQTSFPVQGKSGDPQTYAFIAIIKDYGVSADKAFELLHEPVYADGKSWNDKCEPCWDAGELQKKFENVYKYGCNQPGSKGGVMESLGDYGIEFAQQAVAAATAEGLSALEKMFFYGDDLIHRSVKREMVIPEWLLAHGVTAFLAKRGTGKTVTMLDMAARIACDMDWHGLPTMKDMAVIYLCGEDDFGLQDQLTAWCQFYDRSPDKDRFIAVTGIPNLMSGEDVAVYAKAIREKITTRRCVLFFDTWQRATSHASQNDDKDMQNSFANAEAMAKALDGCAIIAFHPPKNNPDTIMGSSIVENSTVGIWRMDKDTNQMDRVMKVIRLKGKGEGNGMQFEFRMLGLKDFDQFGKERTGLVPIKRGQSKENGEIEFTVDKNARAVYATIIARLWLKHKDAVLDKKEQAKGSDFSTIDAARRVIGFFEARSPESIRFETMLAEARDRGWAVTADTFQRHLMKMFVSDGSPQRTHDGDILRAVPKGAAKMYKFEVEKEEKKTGAEAPADLVDNDMDF